MIDRHQAVSVSSGCDASDKDGFLNFEEWHKILRRTDSKEDPESPTSPSSKEQNDDLSADPMAL